MQDIVSLFGAILESRIFEIVFGAALAIGFAILVEYFRRPQLRLSIAPRVDLQKPNGTLFRSLRILVSHQPLPKGLRWMLRGPASQCQAVITFHHLDGQNYFGRTMPARWAGTLEPVQLAGITPQGHIVTVLDPAKIVAASRMDIYPGEEETLDVVVRFDADVECYGWNNYTYLHDDWRNPDWRLPPGRYLVKAKVTSSGETWVDVFRLINDVASGTDFRLEPATRQDKRQEALALNRRSQG